MIVQAGDDWSLGEVQSLCVKAARGAGRAVGLAEDAGRAARWLHARGQDGTGALARLLQATDGLPVSKLVPRLPDFSPAHEGICPLVLGGYLSDMGTLPSGPIGPVWSPELLQPLLANLSASGVDVVFPPSVHEPVTARMMPRMTMLNPSQSRAEVSPETMDALLVFAARTYAPATAQSRAGAGSALSDND
ncbi:DUF3726 domain-containing protein [Jannaschia sp. CCS1]|uniref:DUF3726 domain-containing protein n=1 Tax=Jannaschia sp. (strain CCS1) TaxID=290400 RepID=UPI000053AD8B|nr:DUF3726 domain-containing protein [Jannaschia sp. CCS1]ABD54521.1 hypothetical protein Jann_1604 [Jannaschia sp. CCS1]